MTFDPRWSASALNASIYAWARNSLGLMRLRESCSTPCWMSDGAWTEWKSCSPPPLLFALSPHENTRRSIFQSATTGTPPPSNNDSTASETNTPALKNVQRLRTSKSLTRDDLSVTLAASSVSATTPSRRSVYATPASPVSGKTSSPSFVSVNSNRLWTADGPGSDPIADVREWQKRMRREWELGNV